MSKIPQPIPYQGSKRNIAEQIFGYVPPQIDQFVEPFAGSAALSISAATLNRAHRFWLNDLNAPLMALLEMIITAPAEISDKYTALWHQQSGREKEHDNEVQYLRQSRRVGRGLSRMNPAQSGQSLEDVRQY